jgi:hypothetical protein
LWCAAAVLLLIGTVPVMGQEHRLDGALFPPSCSGESDPLYRWEFVQDAAGTWRTRYLTPAGAVAAEDELVWAGNAPAAYRYRRDVAGELEVSSLERAGDRLVFTRSKGGKTDRAEEPAAGLFAVGPSLAALVQAHWAALSEGQRLRVNYGVLDQLRTFAFDVFRVPGAQEPGGPDQAVIRMRIANVFLRMFVDPIDLVFSPSGDVLREIRGRALPVANREGSPKAVDANLVIANPQPLQRVDAR